MEPKRTSEELPALTKASQAATTAFREICRSISWPTTKFQADGVLKKTEETFLRFRFFRNYSLALIVAKDA
jgi:hypothetical protein